MWRRRNPTCFVVCLSVFLAFLMCCDEKGFRERVRRRSAFAPESVSHEDPETHRLRSLISENASIISQFPNHPLSENLFSEIVRLMARIDNIPPSNVCLKLVYEHPNDNLGLYALGKWVETSVGFTDTRERLSEIIDRCPDMAVGAYALDKLIEEDLKAGRHLDVSKMCERLVLAHPKTKVCRISMLRAGQACSEVGDWRRATGVLLRFANEYPEMYAKAGASRWLEECYRRLGLEWWIASEIAENEPNVVLKAQDELSRWTTWESVATRVESGAASETEQWIAELFLALGDKAKVRAFITLCPKKMIEGAEAHLVLARLLTESGLEHEVIEEYEAFVRRCSAIVQEREEREVLAQIARLYACAYRGLDEYLLKGSTGGEGAYFKGPRYVKDLLRQIGQQVVESQERLVAAGSIANDEKVKALLRLIDLYKCQGLTGMVIHTYHRMGREFCHRPDAARCLMKVAELELNEWKACDAARLSYHEVMRVFPDSNEAQEAACLAAGCRYVEGRYDEAIFELRKLLDAEHPDDIKALAQFLLGLCYAGKGEYRRASEEFESIVLKYSENEIAPRAEYEAIGMHLMDGRREDARAALRRLVHTFENSEYTLKGLYKYGELVGVE